MRSWLKHDARTIAAADLRRVVVQVAAATVHGARSSRLAVQYPIAAHARSIVIHHRIAAARVRHEHAISDFVLAANPRLFVLDQFIAAGVVLGIDDRITAAVRVHAVYLRHDFSLAAPVSLEVVHLRAATGRVPTVGAVLQFSVAADGILVVVSFFTTAKSIATM